MNKLLKALTQMEEYALVNEVVCPLIKKLHPGKIEYTHSANEAGRDIISFGKDTLKRQNILCVQVKANKITYGAQFQGIVVNPSKMAKTEGVTIENGTSCIPNEIWYITSSPFPEQERRQISETLKDLERNNIKFIAGEELSELLTLNLPDLAKELCKYANKEIVNLISILSRHTEGIAFEMDFERNINEFYVTASFSPSFNKYYLSNEFEDSVLDFKNTYERKITDYLIDDKDICSETIEKLIINREISRTKSKKIHQLFGIKFDIYLLGIYKKIPDFPVEKVSLIDLCACYKNIKNLADIYIYFCKVVHLNAFFKILSKKTKYQISKCPKTLTVKTKSIVNTHHLIKEIESFISLTNREYDNIVFKQNQDSKNDLLELRIQIKNPENILGLGTNILVEGQPGCGKTTLLRKVAVALLEKNKKLKFLNCCTINNLYRDKSLDVIVDKFAIGKTNKDIKNSESILILDGLDESPFDISDKITQECDNFLSIIASTRIAYDTSIRNGFFSIVLDPFSREERDQFFTNLFREDKVANEACQQLFFNYPDIDYHSKIPLIASIVATLIKNGFTPTTRSEIYNFRLELLLSKWDRVRGVSRVQIDNPKAKIRFLKELAFKMHNLETRNRFIDLIDLRNAYENSLGSWGYQYDFNTFLADLVVGSGVLIEVSNKRYSFGHLSFQEHLVGEYLAEKASLKNILGYLGNDWWREPLNFWASSKGSITDLLDGLLETEQYHFYTEQLLELTMYAPYTSAGIVEILKEAKFAKDY